MPSSPTHRQWLHKDAVDRWSIDKAITLVPPNLSPPSLKSNARDGCCQCGFCVEETCSPEKGNTKPSGAKYFDPSYVGSPPQYPKDIVTQLSEFGYPSNPNVPIAHATRNWTAQPTFAPTPITRGPDGLFTERRQQTQIFYTSRNLLHDGWCQDDLDHATACVAKRECWDFVPLPIAPNQSTQQVWECTENCTSVHTRKPPQTSFLDPELVEAMESMNQVLHETSIPLPKILAQLVLAFCPPNPVRYKPDDYSDSQLNRTPTKQVMAILKAPPIVWKWVNAPGEAKETTFKTKTHDPMDEECTHCDWARPITSWSTLPELRKGQSLYAGCPDSQ